MCSAPPDPPHDNISKKHLASTIVDATQPWSTMSGRPHVETSGRSRIAEGVEEGQSCIAYMICKKAAPKSCKAVNSMIKGKLTDAASGQNEAGLISFATLKDSKEHAIKGKLTDAASAQNKADLSSFTTPNNMTDNIGNGASE